MQFSHEEQRANVPRPVIYYLSLSAFLWFCCAAMMAFWRFVQHRGYPYNSPFMQDDLCRDLWCYRPQFLALHTRNFFKFQGMELFPYPPASALPFSFFQNVLPQFHSIPYIGLTFLAVSGLFFALAFAIMHLGLSRSKSIALAAGSFLLIYPFPFVWTTGNIEVVLFLILTCGVLAFLRGRYLLAAVLIGFCAAMKLYPFVLLVLLLSKKQYKAILLGIGTFFVAELAGLWLMCPDIRFAFRSSQAALQINRVNTMQSFLTPQSAADHSIWGLVKTLAFVATRHTHFASRSMTVYLACMAMLGGILYFGRIRNLPVLNQVFSLYLCMLILVPESFEYTLIHLCVPFGLLMLYAIQCNREALRVKGLTPAFVCFAIIFSPLNELILRGHGFWGQTKCVVLILLLAIALTRRWDSASRAASDPMLAWKSDEQAA